MDPTTKQQDLIGKYLAHVTDRLTWEDGEHAPRQALFGELSGNTIDYFINAEAYFTALEAEMDALSTSTSKRRFLYLSAWWLGLAKLPETTVVQPFGKPARALLRPLLKALADPSKVGIAHPALTLPSGRLLSEKLAELHASGADVRILGWVSPAAARYAIPILSRIRAGNVQTLLSVAEMRGRFGGKDAGKVMVNLVAHPLGAAHCKLVVVGDHDSIRAFTGGIDPVLSRLAANWHDLAVRVTGPAAIAIYRFFQELWAENLNWPAESILVDGAPIESRLNTADTIPEPPTVERGDGTGACVQVLRTVPRMRFSTAGPSWIYEANAAVRKLITAGIGFRKPPVGFAPTGCFEFKVALHKAISRAERYVFIADQAFTSEEIMDWINARLLQKPDLKVILLHGSDPDDPPSGDLPQAVNHHLVPGLPPLPGGGGFQGVEFYEWPGTTVHCKVTIVDDVCCIVGSANAMRRSLYTDIELSVAILDATNTGIVRELRRDLWATYCGMSLNEANVKGYDELLDIDNALSLWSTAWGGALPPGTEPLSTITRVTLPMRTPASFSKEDHDRQDPDSRMIF